MPYLTVHAGQNVLRVFSHVVHRDYTNVAVQTNSDKAFVTIGEGTLILNKKQATHPGRTR